MKEPDPHLCVLKPEFIQTPEFFIHIYTSTKNPIRGGYRI